MSLNSSIVRPIGCRPPSRGARPGSVTSIPAAAFRNLALTASLGGLIGIEKGANYVLVERYRPMPQRPAGVGATQVFGRSWASAPVTVDNAGDVGMYNALGIDSAGKVHLAYVNSDDSALYYRENAGGLWSSAVSIATSSPVTAQVTLAVDLKDRVHIAWGGGIDGLSLATNESGSWLTYQVDTTSGTGYDNAVAVGLNDRGLLRAGYRGDVNVIDFDKLQLGPPRVRRDLPAGGARLVAMIFLPPSSRAHPEAPGKHQIEQTQRLKTALERHVDDLQVRCGEEFASLREAQFAALFAKGHPGDLAENAREMARGAARNLHEFREIQFDQFLHRLRFQKFQKAVRGVSRFLGFVDFAV